MPPNFETPVRAQLGLRGVLGNGKNGSGLCTRPLGRRRIFVQTDTGSVLGIELDRADNVQTVKKKMQNILNVPPEQTALVFGDVVFKSDLSKLRNYSPLLLRREIHRSISTPCFSPSVEGQGTVDVDQPIEVVGGLTCCSEMKKIINDILQAVHNGIEPVAASGGLGGAYFFRNIRGENIAIVKPTDEEPFAPNNPKGFVGKSLGKPGLKKAVRVGETGVREVAAYLLDHKKSARVPPTVLVKVSHHALHVNNDCTVHKGPEAPVAKIASCQQFVPHDYDASDHGTSRFSVSAVHRIGILDIRIFNTDRHAGNILIRNVESLDKEGSWGSSIPHVKETLELIPIDHGLCLPEALEDPYFEWLHWPQASVPFSEEELDYIQNLNEKKDVDMLRTNLPMLREACFRVLILSTILLKVAASAGLTLGEIGEMMTRDVMEERSELELLCIKARFQVQRELMVSKSCEANEDSVSEHSSKEDIHEQFDIEMDSKLFAVLDSDQSECVNLSAWNCSLASVLCTPQSGLVLSNSSTIKTPEAGYVKYPQLSPVASILEDEEVMPNSCNISEPKPSLWKNGCAAPNFTLPFGKLEISNGRAHTERSPRLKPKFCPLVEEEEVNVLEGRNTKASINPYTLNFLSPRVITNRGASFGIQRKIHSEHPEKGPASETTGKANANGNSVPLSLSDLTEEEWECFMECFKRLLQEAVAIKVNQNASSKLRLGMSCQF